MDTRLAVGLSIDSDCGEFRAALVRVVGIGLDCTVQCLAAAAAPMIPGATNRLSQGNPDLGPASRETDRAPCGIAQQLFDLVRTVADRAGVPIEQILLLGVKGDAGSQFESQAAMIAACLAELTGSTIVAGFSDRDRAAGGRGKPLDPLVDWIVAHDARLARMVVHMDSASSVTYFPAAGGPGSARTFETGPGTLLLENLAALFTRDRKQVDSRGVLAVQGRQIKPLVRRWATHPFFRQEPPKHFNADDFAGPIVDEAYQLAVERGWSVADVLCTATHFVAACPADAVRQFLIKDNRIDQVVYVGRGTQNGFLLRLLEEQFNSMGVTTIVLPAIVSDSYGAITAALLGCLALDGVPCNLPAITGAAGPRRLGHLVPGSPQNWRQCAEWISRSVKPAAARAA